MMVFSDDFLHFLKIKIFFLSNSSKLSCGFKVKKSLDKTLIWSVLLYDTETWTQLKSDIKRLEAFEMCWRRMLKISWMDKVHNEEVKRRVNELEGIIDIINKRKKS